jgi:hypothetical protein
MDSEIIKYNFHCGRNISNADIKNIILKNTS